MTSLSSPPISPPLHSPTLGETPKVGILLNGESSRRYSGGNSSRPLSISTNVPQYSPSSISLNPPSPSSPLSTKSFTQSQSQAQSQSQSQQRPTSASKSVSPASSKAVGSAKIRFAPLPDPAKYRPRSLSTGRNIAWTASEDDDGNEVRHMEVRNIPQSQVHYDNEDDTVSDDEYLRTKGSRGGGDDEERGRRWSKGVESSWKISKKILTVGMWDEKDKDSSGGGGGNYGGGAPLKKSISTGGMTGSSPLRWSGQEERARKMQGLSSSPSNSNSPFLSTSSSSSSANHRRMSSFEASAAASFAPSTSVPSAPKVKMLNGRVYGARRASEAMAMAKAREKEREPEFVEWGNAKQGGGGKSVLGKEMTGGGRGMLSEDDDGSGMGWVRRRREERERLKKEQEEKEAREKKESEKRKEASGGIPDEIDEKVPKLSSSLPSDQETDEKITLNTPSINIKDLPSMPPTPIIHISEPMSPGITTGSTGLSSLSSPSSSPPSTTINKSTNSGGSLSAGNGKVKPIAMKRKEKEKEVMRGTDVFDTSDKSDKSGNEDEAEEEEEGDDSDQGDFSSDDEEELRAEEEEKKRSTSSAAGIELVATHRHHQGKKD